MTHHHLDRFRVKMEPLSARSNRFGIETTAVDPSREPGPISAAAGEAIAELAARVRTARQRDRPVICAFGAHAIKNGLAPVLVRLISDHWITHLATNGAGIIHDWEFSYLGAVSYTHLRAHET